VPNLDAFTRAVRDAAAPGATVSLTVDSNGVKRALKVAVPKPSDEGSK
jgi:S1-C subfamily serine protease